MLLQVLMMYANNDTTKPLETWFLALWHRWTVITWAPSPPSSPNVPRIKLCSLPSYHPNKPFIIERKPKYPHMSSVSSTPYAYKNPKINKTMQLLLLFNTQTSLTSLYYNTPITLTPWQSIHIQWHHNPSTL